jgi:hypothetical protein
MRWIRTLGSLALAGLAGCGDPEDRAPLVPVTGTVTLNSKPLAGARLTFMPDTGNAYNTPGVDASGPEGTYKAMFKQRSGLSPGKYKVTVEPSLVSPGDAKIPEAFKDDPFMFQKGQEAKNRGKKAPAASKDKFDIEVSDQGGVFDFDVKASAAK